MDTISEYTTVKSKVEYLLSTQPDTRESDKLLVLTYYKQFCSLRCGGFDELKTWLMQKKVPSFTTIVRCRTWLQTNTPALRGKNWKKRAKRAEDVSEFISDISGYGSYDG